MKFVLFYALFILASVVRAFRIVPPAIIVTCEPLTIRYDTTDGQAPFSLSFHKGSAGGPVVAAFTGITGASYTWNRVTILAGTNIVIVLGDSGGVGSATPVIPVSRGSSDVCLNSLTSIPPITPITSSTATTNASESPTLAPPPPTMGPTRLWPPNSIGSTSSIGSTRTTGNTRTTGSTSSSSSTSSISNTDGIGNTAGDFTIGAIAIGAITAIVAAVLA